jgi:hypothetical protein
MNKAFKDFLTTPAPQDEDYIVGYQADGEQEMKVPFSALKLLMKGDAGNGASMQFSPSSANPDGWHYPGMDTDRYVRFRTGTDPWSPAFKIVADEPTGGGSGEDAREVELQNNGTHIQWRYVGDVDWQNLVALSSLKGDAGTPGQAATVSVAAVITGAPGTAASVTNVGTAQNAAFYFTIPRGEPGEQCPPGSGGGYASKSLFIKENTENPLIVEELTSKLMVQFNSDEEKVVVLPMDWENPFDIDIIVQTNNLNGVRLYFAIENEGTVYMEEFVRMDSYIMIAKLIPFVSEDGQKSWGVATIFTY